LAGLGGLSLLLLRRKVWGCCCLSSRQEPTAVGACSSAAHVVSRRWLFFRQHLSVTKYNHHQTGDRL
jgi:hypothetical protein